MIKQINYLIDLRNGDLFTEEVSYNPYSFDATFSNGGITKTRKKIAREKTVTVIPEKERHGHKGTEKKYCYVKMIGDAVADAVT